MKPLRILTWHTHGNYLYYLTQVPHEFYVLMKHGRPPGYGGRCGPFPWGPNVHDMPIEEARHRQFDCILFQDDTQYLSDQYQYLGSAQRRLPRIYLEHDPPQAHPTNARHPVDDPDVLLVHVTPFNALMWDSGRSPTRVIEHGVVVPPDARYSGEIERGVVVVNNLARRGRRLGLDVFEEMREQVPLDLVGMGAQALRGLGEIPPPELPHFIARYRFFFNPIRYTSLGLAVVEAMSVGLPILGLATTEMATAVVNGVSGYVDTDPAKLVPVMQALLKDPEQARWLGQGAQRIARERFSIDRFVSDWAEAFAWITGRPAAPRAPGTVTPLFVRAR